MADAIWYPRLSEYVHISLSGGLNHDTPGSYIDTAGSQAPKTITVTARTSWLRLQLLNGFQRVRWLFVTGTFGHDIATDTMGDSSFSVAVDFDYSEVGFTAPGAYNFTVASTFATKQYSGAPFAIRSKLRRQKCEAVSFTFTDVPTLAAPAGVTLQGITLQVGMKRGVGKLRAAQNVG